MYDPTASGTPKFERLGVLYDLASSSRYAYNYHTGSPVRVAYVAFPIRYYATPGMKYMLGGEKKAAYIRDIEP